jgi:anti-sigma regulatory factor (Ser/Thr protein kinase)
MPGPISFQVTFPGGNAAGALARRALSERLFGLLSREGMGDLHLLVTEIVSNGVRHGHVAEDGRIELWVRLTDALVRVEMRDSGIQADPRVRSPDLAGGGGFGMVLVERMSERWGVDHEPHSELGSRVVMWFELRRDPAATTDAAESVRRRAAETPLPDARGEAGEHGRCAGPAARLHRRPRRGRPLVLAFGFGI